MRIPRSPGCSCLSPSARLAGLLCAFVPMMWLGASGSLAWSQDEAPDRWETVPLKTPAAPPAWALWQRQVLEQNYPAALALVDKYTRPGGELIWRDQWPGMDGSDDGYESFYNFPLLYVLGGHPDLVPLSEKLWDGVTRQFTRYGQIHNEFDAHYDWMHHGESYTYFYFFGLSNPHSPVHRERSVDFARMYTGEDPDAPNYDPEKNLIRSPLTGSKGPHFENTAEDWVTHRPILAHYPLPYDDIAEVESSQAWNDDQQFPHILKAINQRMMKGDVPLNLAATSMMANAYMHTGDEKYRRWVADYVQGWIDRTEQNDGILPDNVGLSGEIGENMDGKWWGGYYGWKWPHGLFNQLEATIIGGCNAYLVTGDPKYLELPRSVIDLVSEQGRKEGGRTVVPHRYGDQGWYDFRAINAKYLAHLWFVSRADQDWQRLLRLTTEQQRQALDYHKGKGDSEHPLPWLSYVRGESENSNYPLQILKACYAETQKRLAAIRADQTTPDQQDVHHWQKLNPVVLEGLVQTMLGAPNHIYHGGLLQASLRYFDPANRRPGVPPDVAVLVERLTPGGLRLKLVNLNPAESRRVLLQGGMFGEHHFTRVRQVVHYPYQFDTIDARCFEVELGPGAVGRLEIGMKRYAHQPTYRFPWDR